MAETWVEKQRALVLVDFSAIAYACWATAERAETAGKEALGNHVLACPLCRDPSLAAGCQLQPKQYDPHEVLKSNLKMKLATIVEDTPVTEPYELVMVLDSRAQWRYDALPSYKGKREERFNPRPEAEAFLRECYPSMQWVKAPGQEADDGLATLTRANKGQRVIVLVTGDKDIWSLFDPPQVRIYNPITQKYLDHEKVAEKFNGLEPKHIRMWKALWGDPSDSLPNCAPRQQKNLVPLIKAADGDLMKLIELAAQGTNERCREHLSKNIEQVFANWAVAGLNDHADLEWT